MVQTSQFDPELIKRYDKSGPRYTSYPTAVAFNADYSEDDYRRHAELSNQQGGPLSLYFHIPFCDTVCFYCACNKIATKDYSKSPVYLQHLYREIEIQSQMFDRDRVVEQLHFGGGTPTFLSAEQMAQLMQKTAQHFQLLTDGSGDYSIEIDPRSVTRETIAALREMGFTRFSLGVQDINPAVQQAVNRIQPLDMTIDIIDACREQSARSVNVDLIYGLPLQTLHSFAETLDKIIEVSPDRLSVFNYAHLPKLFKPQRRIDAEQLPSAEEKLAILGMSIEKLTNAGYEYIGMDHFAKPDDELAIAQREGSLHRNFQGYTTHADCDLVAMGVSAISSVADSYSQNSKDLEAYYQSIEQGHLPIIKGLAMTTDDKIRRAVIQELACHFRLEYNRVERQFQLEFDDYFARELEDLQQMQQDGLLTVNDNFVEVTARGRFLIRNICMVFDRRTREQTQEVRFSKVI